MIKYIASTKDRGINIKPEPGEPWTIEVFVDSYFCGDRDNRKIDTGFVTFIEKVVAVNWKSKANRTSISQALKLNMCLFRRQLEN